MKKYKLLVSMVLICALIMGMIPCVSAQAATVKLNKTSLSLKVGKSKTLKLKNVKRGQKIKWTSSKKKVAAVSSRGKVTAKKKGKAVITATVKGKKYRCRVTVKGKAKKDTAKKRTVKPTTVPKIKPAGPAVAATEKPAAKPQEVKYYCDAVADYNNEINSHRLFFGLKASSDGERIASTGTVRIAIKNMNGEIVYSDQLSFDESDFAFYYSSSWHEYRYLCCIIIPDYLIEDSKESIGELEFSIICNNNTICESEKIYIFDLPTYSSSLISYMSLYGQVSPESATKKYVSLFMDCGEVESGDSTASSSVRIYYYPESDTFDFQQYFALENNSDGSYDFLYFSMETDTNLTEGFIQYSYYPDKVALSYSGNATVDLTSIKRGDTINFKASMGQDFVNETGNLMFNLGMTNWDNLVRSCDLGFGLTEMGVSYFS